MFSEETDTSSGTHASPYRPEAVCMHRSALVSSLSSCSIRINTDTSSVAIRQKGVIGGTVQRIGYESIVLKRLPVTYGKGDLFCNRFLSLIAAAVRNTSTATFSDTKQNPVQETGTKHVNAQTFVTTLEATSILDGWRARYSN
jgi:hypothetical protein